MAEGKCDKCGAPTSNRGNMFRCGSGMVDYSSKGAKLIQTTTTVTETHPAEERFLSTTDQKRRSFYGIVSAGLDEQG